MRILLKLPTRSRPTRFLDTLKKYVEFANHPEQMGIAISCDVDDPSMQFNFSDKLTRFEWSRVFYGNNKTKIEACNANMSEVDYDWDIVMLISDDMIPQVRGYDDIVRSYIDRDKILWLSDGYQNNICTLSIMGRNIYESFGYIYAPQYKSFFCDDEFSDLCKTTLKDKCIRVDNCVIKHKHPVTGFPETYDSLYVKNSVYYIQDLKTYLQRKKYEYDWTILIATLEERRDKFNALFNRLTEMKNRICPSLNIEILAMSDNREMSIGNKRQSLLTSAKGRYVSFIDDDDDVTDAYFEDGMACILGKYDVCRLVGKIGDFNFIHSVDNPITGPSANDTSFLRPPNHLNIMLTGVAKTQKFKDVRNGEDADWAVRISKSHYLDKEYQPDISRIHYIYNIKFVIDKNTLNYQKTIPYEEMFKHLIQPEPPRKEPKGLRLGPKGFVSK